MAPEAPAPDRPKKPPWGDTVRDYLTALVTPVSWLPHRNGFALAGFAWGLPVPFVTLLVDCHVRGIAMSPTAAAICYGEHPVHWLFLVHPILFAGLFGAAGTVAHDRAARIAALLDALRVRADTDGLTGLANHRAFQERLAQEGGRAARSRGTFSLLLLDVDRFKGFNDRFGHPAGDALLRELATRLRAVVRHYDVVARYGGEEFAVLLPELDAEGAAEAAERVRRGVSGTLFELPGTGAVSVTVSVGAATWRPGEPVAETLSRADTRCYAAKRAGRNRICTGLEERAIPGTAQDSAPRG